jgi:hypothetical protein
MVYMSFVSPWIIKYYASVEKKVYFALQLNKIVFSKQQFPEDFFQTNY